MTQDKKLVRLFLIENRKTEGMKKIWKEKKTLRKGLS